MVSRQIAIALAAFAAVFYGSDFCFGQYYADSDVAIPWGMSQRPIASELAQPFKPQVASSSELASAAPIREGKEVEPKLIFAAGQAKRVAQSPATTGGACEPLLVTQSSGPLPDPTNSLSSDSVPYDCKHILEAGKTLNPECSCDSAKSNSQCRIFRFDRKPTLQEIEARIGRKADLKCLSCVREPYVCKKKIFENTDVVFYRCKTTVSPPQSKSECEDGKCVSETTSRSVTELEACTSTIPLEVVKEIVQYRKVWIYIECPL